MARTPIIIDPVDHHGPTPTIPGIPDEEFPRADETPTGPGIDAFFNTPTAVPIGEPSPVEVYEEEEWEKIPPPSNGIPDWAPVSAMCLCGMVGMWALVDRLLL